MKKLLVSLAVALWCSTAHAWITFGAVDCGQWVNNARSRPGYQAWLSGFLSGLNGAHQVWTGTKQDPLDQLTSMDQAYVWMDTWCKDHPLESAATGGMVLFDELRVRASKGK